MKYTKIFLLLLTLNWTVSYGQVGKNMSIVDTVTCYTNAELQKIAIKVVLANELDTVLKLSQLELINQSNIILKQTDQLISKDNIIAAKDTIINSHNSIVAIKDEQITERDKSIKKLNGKVKLMKTGWLASVVGMIVIKLLWL